MNYPVNSTALILIDVLNDFLADDGKLNAAIGPMLQKLETKANLQRLLTGARAAGLKVFYAPHGIDEHSFDDIPRLLPRMQWALDNKMLWKGTPGADFYAPLAPLPGETVISRHRMFDSFIGTDLQVQLKAQGIVQVILAGLTSHTCIEGTGRHALEAGYHVTFVKDAVAEFTEAAHQHAVELSYPTFGHAVLTVEKLLAQLPTS